MKYRDYLLKITTAAGHTAFQLACDLTRQGRRIDLYLIFSPARGKASGELDVMTADRKLADFGESFELGGQILHAGMLTREQITHSIRQLSNTLPILGSELS